jgi:hypothetical protein
VQVRLQQLQILAAAEVVEPVQLAQMAQQLVAAMVVLA